MMEQLAATETRGAVTVLVAGLVVAAAGVNMALQNHRALKTGKPLSAYSPFNPTKRRILMWCGWAFALCGALLCLAGTAQALGGS